MGIVFKHKIFNGKMFTRKEWREFLAYNAKLSEEYIKPIGKKKGGKTPRDIDLLSSEDISEEYGLEFRLFQRNYKNALIWVDVRNCLWLETKCTISGYRLLQLGTFTRSGKDASFIYKQGVDVAAVWQRLEISTSLIDVVENIRSNIRYQLADKEIAVHFLSSGRISMDTETTKPTDGVSPYAVRRKTLTAKVRIG